MKTRDRLRSLRQLAQHAEAENARRMAERMQALSLEEQRLRQIHGYLQEYQQRLGSPGALTTVGNLQGGRHFMERLRTAVGEQQGIVENHRRQVEQQSTLWRAARARAKALEKLAERRQEAEARKREAREQRRLDELGLRRL